MPPLSGDLAAKLSEALRDAFTLDELARLLFIELEKRIDDITLAGSYQARVFDLILTADREGWLPRLVAAACGARPGDRALADIRDSLSRRTAGPVGPAPGQSDDFRLSWGPGLGEPLFQARLRAARGQLVVGFGGGDALVVADQDAAVRRWSHARGAEMAGLSPGDRLRDGIHVAIATSRASVAFARPGRLTVTQMDVGMPCVPATMPLGKYEFIARGGGERFATYDGRRVAVRDFRDGTVLWEHPCPRSLATTAMDATGTVAATADGRLGARGNTVAVGTRETPRLHSFTLGNVPFVGAGCVLGLSPGGKLLAAASVSEIILARPHTGDLVFRHPLRGFRQSLPVLGTRPQQLIPIPGDAVLWLRGGRVVVVRKDSDDLHYLGQDGDISDIAFDHCTSRLAMVNSGGLASVWRWNPFPA